MFKHGFGTCGCGDPTSRYGVLNYARSLVLSIVSQNGIVSVDKIPGPAIVRPRKTSLGSHQLPHLIFTTTKKSHAPRPILNLGKHVKYIHFSDDMVFSLTLIIFNFFLMWTKIFIFQFKKKSLHSSFFFFFLMRTKTIIFRDLSILIKIKT